MTQKSFLTELNIESCVTLIAMNGQIFSSLMLYTCQINFISLFFHFRDHTESDVMPDREIYAERNCN